MATIATTIARNGSQSFILPCRKIVLNYCENGGSSRGMLEYLQKNLVPFARQNPQIEIVVKPKPGKHPLVTGYYMNGRDKVVCVRNLDPRQIQEKINLVRDSSGSKLRKENKAVRSSTPSVRGIYSSFHADPVVI